MTTFFVLFAGITLAALAIGQVLAPANAVSARADRLMGPARAALPQATGTGGMRQLVRRLDLLLRDLDLARALDRRLWQAGVPWTPAEFALASTGLAIGLGLVGMTLAGGLRGLVLGVGGLLSFVLLRRKAAMNRRKFVDQLPDALLLVVNALKAGHGLQQALKIVSSQLVGPVGTEFGVVLAEINLGLSTEMAVGNLSDRVDQVEMDLAVDAILVQRATGGNLAEILTHLQDTLRDRARIAGEVNALTPQGRLSGWVLSVLPLGIGVLFMVINPGYLQPFLIDPRGRSLALGAVGAQLLGMLAIRKIVDVRY